MKILFASPERDLLLCFRELLELSSHKVDTFFDGTQIFQNVPENGYDFAVIDSNLPRAYNQKLLSLFRSRKIPCVVMISGEFNSKMLKSAVLPYAFLQYPFMPEELTDIIDRIEKTLTDKEKLSLGGVDIDTSTFTTENGDQLTLEEINAVKAINERNGTPMFQCVDSLNVKLKKYRKKIGYLVNEGYKVVTLNE